MYCTAIADARRRICAANSLPHEGRSERRDTAICVNLERASPKRRAYRPKADSLRICTIIIHSIPPPHALSQPSQLSIRGSLSSFCSLSESSLCLLQLPGDTHICHCSHIASPHAQPSGLRQYQPFSYLPAE